MAEYIEREKIFPNGVFFVNASNPMTSLDELINRINNIPAADVVEVRWKPIIGFEGLYEVSTLGQVRNKNGLFMKQCLKRDKYTVYKKVALWKDGKYKHFYVHRLVAEAFIPNPDNLPIVNHKDEDGTNNLPNNLEWCDKSYNARYGKSLERIKKAARKRKPTEEQKAKTSASMKLYRQKERAEKGYCDNGKRGGAKMDGKDGAE